MDYDPATDVSKRLTKATSDYTATKYHLDYMMRSSQVSREALRIAMEESNAAYERLLDMMAEARCALEANPVVEKLAGL